MLDFAGIRILVLGDVMLDRFLYGAVDRISPEAPVPGGAAAPQPRHARAAPATWRATSRPSAARRCWSGWSAKTTRRPNCGALLAADPGVEDATVASAARPTTCKMRVIAGTSRWSRLDEEEARPPTTPRPRRWSPRSGAAPPRLQAALMLSDYAKGVLTPAVVAGAIAAAHAAGIPVFADPKSDDFALYRGADCLTPNARELARAARLPTGTEAEVAAAARAAMARGRPAGPALHPRREGHDAGPRGRRGHAACRPRRARCSTSPAPATPSSPPWRSRIAAGRAAARRPMRIANAAAGIVVGKLGTGDGRARRSWRTRCAPRGSDAAAEGGGAGPRRRVAAACADWRAHGLRVGFTNGCFDILHAGHVALLRRRGGAATGWWWR